LVVVRRAGDGRNESFAFGRFAHVIFFVLVRFFTSGSTGQSGRRKVKPVIVCRRLRPINRIACRICLALLVSSAVQCLDKRIDQGIEAVIPIGGNLSCHHLLLQALKLLAKGGSAGLNRAGGGRRSGGLGLPGGGIRRGIGFRRAAATGRLRLGGGASGRGADGLGEAGRAGRLPQRGASPRRNRSDRGQRGPGPGGNRWDVHTGF